MIASVGGDAHFMNETIDGKQAGVVCDPNLSFCTLTLPV
jgi:hypothetical protein